MQTIDKAFPEEMFISIKQKISSNDFNWNFIPVTGYDDKQSMEDCRNFHLVHICLSENKVHDSPVYDELVAGLKIALKTANIELDEIKRIRVNAFTNVGKHFVHDAHIDSTKPHKIAILYINESHDSVTYVYNEKYDAKSNLDVRRFKQEVLQDKFTVAKKVYPKQNRLFICDGSHYHSSSTPTLVKARIAVNFNFTVKNSES